MSNQRRSAITKATSGPALRQMLRLSIPGEKIVTESTIARNVAPFFEVTPQTIRRWMRTQLPSDRIEQLEQLVRPSASVLEQEAIDLRRTLQITAGCKEIRYGDTPEWAVESFMRPHRLLLVKHHELGVVIPRVGAAPASATARQRQLERIRGRESYAKIVRAEWLFPTRYHAMQARLELLHKLTPWRVQVRPKELERGATQAWLLQARTPHIPWLQPHRIRKGHSGLVFERSAGDPPVLTQTELDVLEATTPLHFAKRRRRRRAR